MAANMQQCIQQQGNNLLGSPKEPSASTASTNIFSQAMK
jgi:hypothetical protein